MRQYEWMIKHTPQTEWIKGPGILFWMAFFFIELGAGICLVSSLFHHRTGEIVGWLTCAVLGGGFHLIYLGHPFRFYRMLMRPQTSWVSRGLIFVSAFLAFEALRLVTGSSNPGLLAVTGAMAFLTIIYGGFAMNYVNGIPLWNSALLPVLFTLAGLWGGAEVSMGLLLLTGAESADLERVVRVLLVGFLLIFPVYLISARYGLTAGRAAVNEMIRGKSWPLFWIGVVLIGMTFPLVFTLGAAFAGPASFPAAALYVSILFGLLGDLVLRYLLLKNGYYSPLVQGRLTVGK